MMWELELRQQQDGEWITWTKGALEDCLSDLWAWRSGDYGDRYDAARLVTERT